MSPFILSSFQFLIALAISSSGFLGLIPLPTAMAQSSGDDDDCTCTPSSYTFQIDFSLLCPGTIAKGDPGIQDVVCLPFNLHGNDMTPESLSLVQFVEFAVVNNVIQSVGQTDLNTGLDNYAVIPFTPTYTDGPLKGLQINFDGQNAAGQSVTLAFTVYFTNECHEYPVLEVGDEMGWMELVDLTKPSVSACPAVPTPPPYCSKSGKKAVSKAPKAPGSSSSKAPKSTKSSKAPGASMSKGSKAPSGGGKGGGKGSRTLAKSTKAPVVLCPDD